MMKPSALMHEARADAARLRLLVTAARRAARIGAPRHRDAETPEELLDTGVDLRRRCRSAAVRDFSRVRMLTTAGPTRSTSSVKSGNWTVCASRRRTGRRHASHQQQAQRGNGHAPLD
jgi:hypothetical protein